MYLINITVPVYNNAPSLSELLARILKTTKETTDIYPKFKFSLTFIDDGSTDTSYITLKSELEEVKHITWKIVKLAKNSGQLAATLAGFSTDKSDFSICMSADLQDPPELITEFITTFINNNSEVIIGLRESREDSIINKIFSNVSYRLAKINHKNIPSSGFDFFFISRKVRDYLLSIQGNNRFIQGDIVASGFEPSFISYKREKRKYGKSGFTFQKKLRVLSDFILDEPTIFTKFFFLVLIINLFMTSLILYLYAIKNLRGEDFFIIQTLNSNVLYILILLIGIYTSRIYVRLMNKPFYIIDKIEES